MAKLSYGSGMSAMACKAGFFFTAGSAEVFTTKPDRRLKLTRYT